MISCRFHLKTVQCKRLLKYVRIGMVAEELIQNHALHMKLPMPPISFIYERVQGAGGPKTRKIVRLLRCPYILKH